MHDDVSAVYPMSHLCVVLHFLILMLLPFRISSCGKVMFSQASVILSGGACVVAKGGMHGAGGVCVPLGGGDALQGCASQESDGHCSGQYASYWNAFLCYLCTSFCFRSV